MAMPVVVLLDGLDSGGGPVVNGVRRYRDRHRLDWQIHALEPHDLDRAPRHAWWILRTGGRVGAVSACSPKWPITSLLGAEGPRHRTVCEMDEYLLGRFAAQHLSEVGYRRTMSIDIQARVRFDQRLRGFVDTCDRLAVSHHHYVRKHGVSAAESDAALMAWIRAQPGPLACYCVIDSQAAWLREVAVQAGVRIPEDFAILGTGDHIGDCLGNEPTLSTVAFPLGLMGEAAGAQVHRLSTCGKQPPVQRLRPYRVIERQSTAPLAPTDDLVAAAVAWLGRNLKEPRPLTALVKVLGVSESTICRRFKVHLGFGPKQAHDQLRIRHAQHLLASTQDKLAIIARKCGFKDATAFGVAFKRRRACTPGEWRRALAAR
jgi:LacI family transcriptional regulator